MAEYIRPHPGHKNHPVDDVPAVRRWRARHEWCAACGRAGDITVHHLIGGSGGRSDEPCNLLALCWDPCHMLAEKLDVRGPSKRIVMYTPGALDGGYITETPRLLPKLTLGICLALKLRADPGELSTAADWQRLEELRGSRLPELEPIPAFFVDLFRRNRPEFGHG